MMKNNYVLKHQSFDNHIPKLMNLIFLATSALLILIPNLSTATNVGIFSMEPSRGATTVKNDVFGDKFNQVIYPKDQGWSESDSLWFYNTTQGSDLLPYDFFISLENANDCQLFRDNEHMNRLRYLPQKSTTDNPDGLPVGVVKDEYKNKNYIGFTCAACHTAQVNFQGTGIRIDGGPASANMSKMLKELSDALDKTRNDPEKRKRFNDRVLKLERYKTLDEIQADLDTYTTRINVYNFINHSDTEYGYARLDAFGRIYNRVLEHVLSEKEISSYLCEKRLDQCTSKGESEISGFASSLGDGSNSRAHIVERLLDYLQPKPKQTIAGWSSLSVPNDKQIQFKNDFFNKPDAPVSYPFLWDTPQYDYVQWNGLAQNAGFGPIGRNTGEVIGVFATLDWQKRAFTPFLSNPITSTREHFRALIGGQGFFSSEYVDFTSSPDNHNLERIEKHLAKLKSPKWDDPNLEKVLPKLDEEKVLRGSKLFDQHCAECHAEIDRNDPNRRGVANMTKLEAIRTDPKMAENSLNYKGRSGVLKNLYVGFDAGDILLQEKSPAVAILTKATLNTVATPDTDHWFITRFGYWAYNLIDSFLSNNVKPSIKMGNYSPDTTAEPFDSLKAYKGRSLNGIWATAPYLHNGSVPTLWHLLLPQNKRPEKFMVGSRELEVLEVGLKYKDYVGFEFNTNLTGNSNSGHEYGTKDIQLSNGESLKALTDQDRWDLIEYLKSL